MPDPNASTTTMPFGEAFGKIVDALRDDKPLLYGLGAAILIIALGTLGLSSNSALTLGVIGILVAGIVVWLIWQAREVQKGAPPTLRQRLKVGSVTGKRIDAQNVEGMTPSSLDQSLTAKSLQGDEINLQNIGAEKRSKE